MMDEKVYRHLVDEAFMRVDAAFESTDPDAAESMYSQGTLTVVFGGQDRFILSPQAPTRQIWVAFRDRAWHFDHHQATGQWMDDRGLGVELYGLVEETTRAETGLGIAIDRTRG